MLPRFFSDKPITSETVALEGPEHQHLTKVLRLKAGVEVTLFDNSGSEFTATITAIGRNATDLVVSEKRAVDRELPYELTLAVALPKGDRQQWLIEKAVELGVAVLTPLVTERGVAQPQDGALRRLEKWVISASKQCGRNRLMKIGAPQPAATCFQHGKAIIAHPDPTALEFDEVMRQQQGKRDELFVAVGPEGGFADAELAGARSAGCAVVDLGPRILRIETAALAMVAGLIYTR